MFDLKAPDRLALLAVEVESDHDDCLVLSWVTKGSGFGMTTFWEHEPGVVTVDDEYMGKKFVTSVVTNCAQAIPPETWPRILRRYEGADQLMAAAVLGRPGEW